jgi:hypothetical protein
MENEIAPEYRAGLEQKRLQLETTITNEMRAAMNRHGLSNAQAGAKLGQSAQAFHQVVSRKRGTIPQSLIDALDVLGLELAVREKTS